MVNDPIEYTGHPFVDIGLATMAALVDKLSPKELMQEDLERIAKRLQGLYLAKSVRSFLHTFAFMNCGYWQPTWHSRFPQKLTVYCDRVLGSFALKSEREPDPFFGLPIADVSLDADDRLPPGRAYRQHIPLALGVGAVNFGAEAEEGIPVSGLALLAFQAMPLGCVGCSGGLLAVHSDNAAIMTEFASRAVAGNLLRVQLAEVNHEKMALAARSGRTALVDELLQIERKRSEIEKEDATPFSVTAYSFAAGRTPSLAIYHLPTQVTGFLRRMCLAKYDAKWRAIVARAWQTPRNAKEGQDFEPRYNALYEDIFRLPEEAPRFIRTHFLRVPRQTRDAQDPCTGYSVKEEAQLIRWSITEEFLKGIMDMNQEVIQEIRDMGDRLAQYIFEENDRRFLNAFLMARQYWALRVELLRANMARLRHGDEPLVRFDPFISVFEEGEDVPYSHWRLARDLVVIRIIERLHDMGWTAAHREDLPEPEELVTSEDNEREVS